MKFCRNFSQALSIFLSFWFLLQFQQKEYSKKRFSLSNHATESNKSEKSGLFLNLKQIIQSLF